VGDEFETLNMKRIQKWAGLHVRGLGLDHMTSLAGECGGGAVLEELIMAELKDNLEQQIDEFELLQSMFSGPGEFQVDDEASYDQVIAYVKALTPNTPARLRFTVHILVDARPPLDSEQDSVDGAVTGSKTVQHGVDISFKLPHRYVFNFSREILLD